MLQNIVTQTKLSPLSYAVFIDLKRSHHLLSGLDVVGEELVFSDLLVISLLIRFATAATTAAPTPLPSTDSLI
ncbi:hypothetical protein NECAME_17560 [Necator americanus]|uniref:Uncharacterized protein n=1 Tax=Necator americanus TaxID=51031 RepID=W2TN10_NECAM|nr:hypothetical protein NECAME_17560 [Necator americanus]ETN83158.1 hypothetical protein NECAME_17560 [Necator americanus]